MTSTRNRNGCLWLVLSVCVAATAWLYVHRILGPWANAQDVQKGGLKAQMGDLYPRWVGTREVFLYRHNPYSADVSHEIQMAYYGHIVTAEESQRRVVDEQRFAYPIYVVFLMAPTIYSDFATVQLWAPYVLGAFAGLSVILCVGLLNWKLPWTIKIGLVLCVLSSPQIVQGMRHQQLAIVVASLLVAAAWCVHRGRLGIAGTLLALSTIKPQMALLPLAWFLIWAVADWRNRRRLLIGFGGAITLLTTAGQLLVPGWIGDFLAAVAAYRRYFRTTSVLRLLLGDAVGIGLSVLIVIWLLIFAWRNRKTAEASPRFVSVLAVFLALSVITFPLFTPFNQALLILPTLLIVRDWETFPKAARVIFAALLAWPWISSMVILTTKSRLSVESRVPLIPALASSALPLLLPVLLSMRKKTILLNESADQGDLASA